MIFNMYYVVSLPEKNGLEFLSPYIFMNHSGKKGGYIDYSPRGYMVKGFGSFDMDEEEMSHYFKEIFKFSANCKYGNCTHRHEPGCAVIKAVEDHYISQSRYNSYLNMLEDKEEGKYRAAY